MTKTTVLFLVALLPLAGCQPKEKPAAAPETPAATSTTAVPAAPAPTASAALLSPETARESAPATYDAKFATTKGDFVVHVERAWAPNGADRFYNLVKLGYFDGAPFFRVVQGFMVQFGINAAPNVNAKWREARIPDDPTGVKSNTKGMVTFATAGPNTRTTQIFINYGDNHRLDGQGFTPFGQVKSGMDVVDSLYGGYGDGPPFGTGPDQGRLQMEGAAYTKASFPQMDYIKTARLQ